LDVIVAFAICQIAGNNRMTLKELTEDIASKCPGNMGEMQFLLATRRVNGVLMEDPRQVWLREIAAVEVDENLMQLNLIPKSLWTGEPVLCPLLTVPAFQTYAAENARLAGFEVFVLDSLGQTKGGKDFSMSVSILGVRAGPNNELWIIQYPKEQWPQSWFNKPA
jgi:hypothetical protein